MPAITLAPIGNEDEEGDLRIRFGRFEADLGSVRAVRRPALRKRTFRSGSKARLRGSCTAASQTAWHNCKMAAAVPAGPAQRHRHRIRANVEPFRSMNPSRSIAASVR
jgi:hypothetical protein